MQASANVAQSATISSAPTKDETSLSDKPPNSYTCRVRAIPIGWNATELEDCLDEILQDYSRHLRIWAFHTDAIDSKSQTALLGSEPLPNEVRTEVGTHVNLRSGSSISLTKHPGTKLRIDSACLGLTTLFEPELANDLGTESVHRLVYTSAPLTYHQYHLPSWFRRTCYRILDKERCMLAH